MGNKLKNLNFYIKHSDVMEILYNEEGYDEVLSELEEVDIINLKEMILNVGDNACEEVFDLIKKAEYGVLSSIEKYCNAQSLQKRATIEYQWGIDIWIHPHKKNNSRNWQVGYSLSLESKSIKCWVWAKGGENSEKRLEQIFSRNFPNLMKGNNIGWSAGVVVLDEVQLFSNNKDEIEPEDICQRVENVFSRISKNEL